MELFDEPPINDTTPEPFIVPYTLPLPFIVLSLVTSTSSIFGAAFIIFVYFKLPQIRSTSRKLLVFLSLADLVNASGNLIGTVRYLVYYVGKFEANCDPPETLCVVQSFMTTIGNLWSFFWTVCVAVYLYTVVVHGDSAKADHYIPMFHVFSWTIPVCIMVVALSENVLGEDLTETTPGWCWVSTCSEKMDRVKEIVWMLMTGKFWEITAFTMSATLYIMIRWTLHKTIKRLKAALVQPETLKALTRVVKKMTFVPLVFFFLRIWGSLRFLLAVSATEPINPTLNTILLVLQSFGDSGQGICNCILYCLDSKQIRHLLFACTSQSPPSSGEQPVPSLEQEREKSTVPPTHAFQDDLEPRMVVRYNNHVQDSTDGSSFQRY